MKKITNKNAYKNVGKKNLHSLLTGLQMVAAYNENQCGEFAKAKKRDIYILSSYMTTWNILTGPTKLDYGDTCSAKFITIFFIITKK